MALVGKWLLAALDGSGNTPDASGNGWTGTVKPTYPGDCPAVGTGPCPAIPGGMDFNGTSHYVNVGRPHMVGNVYSIAAWIKTTNSAVIGGGNPARRTIYSGGSNNSALCPVLSTATDARGGFEVTTPGVFDDVSVSGLLTLGGWHHIVYSRAGELAANKKFYFDGRLVGMAAQRSDRPHVNCIADCTIGTRAPTGGSQMWPGSLADVRLYSHALSAAEAYAIYEAFRRDNAQLLGLFP